MKKLAVVLVMTLVLAVAGVATSAEIGDLLGKAYQPPLSQDLINDHGPVTNLGTDNKYAFLYFEKGDFTITVLIGLDKIVAVQDGRM